MRYLLLLLPVIAFLAYRWEDAKDPAPGEMVAAESAVPTAATPPSAPKPPEKAEAPAAPPSANALLQSTENCARELQLPPQGSPEWAKPEVQQSLTECLARFGVDLRAAKDAKSRDLSELAACVKQRWGFEIPAPKRWKGLGTDEKQAIRDCRNVVQGWVLQGQLDRLLGDVD